MFSPVTISSSVDLPDPLPPATTHFSPSFTVHVSGGSNTTLVGYRIETYSSPTQPHSSISSPAQPHSSLCILRSSVYTLHSTLYSLVPVGSSSSRTSATQPHCSSRTSLNCISGLDGSSDVAAAVLGLGLGFGLFCSASCCESKNWVTWDSRSAQPPQEC